MLYKAVLFDLDGTLLDTLQDLADAANAMLSKNGFPTHPLDAYRYFVGDGARNLVTRILPEAKRDEATITRCFNDYRAEYARNWKAHTRPYPGIPEMLDALQINGVKLTVLSNKPHDSTVQCVKELLPKWSFDCVLGQREGIPHKPAPGGALEVAKILGIAPREFLYLGDTATDMQTAAAAGMFAAGALWGFRTAEELLQSGAKVLVKHPMEILALLDNRRR